jgi:hypothetical protein
LLGNLRCGERVDAMVSRVIENELILKVAKNLQASYTKQTMGEPRRWRDVPADERTIWMRLARNAARVLTTEPE